jgi:transposase
MAKPAISTLSLRSSAAPKNQKSFKVLPRRWVGKRIFGWPTRWRRLVRDYEKRIDLSSATILVSMGDNTESEAG